LQILIQKHAVNAVQKTIALFLKTYGVEENPELCNFKAGGIYSIYYDLKRPAHPEIMPGLNVNFKLHLAPIYFFLCDNYMSILFTKYEQKVLNNSIC
jgi:hypothetical protein